MKPITAIVKEKGGAKTYPTNQEVTMNADGSGGPITACGCDKSPAKKIGLQGLGAKGNRGYHVGSPAKKKSFKPHKMYGKDGKVEDAKTKKNHLELKEKGYGHSPAKKIGLQGLGAKGNKGYHVGSPAKCWNGYERVPGTKKNAKGSCRKK